MRVAITGHTSGIGKALFEMFPGARGFSRTNGYDIKKYDDRVRIIEEITDCDVFINNAYAGFCQTDMLFDVWNSWKLEEKKIISIGSRASDNVHTKFPSYEYATHKAALEFACSYMSFQESPCRVTNIKPGSVDTPMISNRLEPKMNVTELAQFIKYVIEMPESFWIPTITIYPVG